MMETHKKQDKISVKGKIKILNDRGLHTRPSTEVVKCATSFDSEVYLRYQENFANAKSLLGVMMLAAGKGAVIQVLATGDDAEKAVESLQVLAARKFDMNY